MTRGLRCALVFSAACAPAEPREVPRAQRDLDGRSILEMQRPASHNTYDNTPGDEDITWHFAAGPRPTRDIEIDIRDAIASRPPIRGDWWVAHHEDEPATRRCGAGDGSLAACLRLIASWRRAHPGHPFTTVWIDKKDEWDPAGGRGPADLDRLLAAHLGPGEVFRPVEMSAAGAPLRQRARGGAWPTHGQLAGRLMFVLTARPRENRRLHAYVASRGAAAWAFVAPHEAASSAGDTRVEDIPAGFDRATARWVAIYNFAWCSRDGDDRCDGAWCHLLDDAAAAGFLTRVWDLDSRGERALAMRAGANFLPVNCPWLAGEAGFCRKNDSCPEDP